MVNATLRLLAVAVTAVLGAGLGAVTAPADAHTDFIGADPPDGATLRELPTDVRLEFSDEMDPGLSTVTLRDRDGASTTLDLANGTNPAVLVAAVPDALVPEDETTTRWTVTFRVVSRDGHPVTGSSTFVVRTPESASASQNQSPPSATDTASPETRPDTGTTSDPEAPGGREQETGDARTLWPAGIGLGVLALLVLAVGTVMRLTGRGTDT